MIDSKQNVIQMKDIEGEERSVVVEGYVFNAEIRELRSGRQLLTFEITDYTSSFAVKKFSRNSDEEAQFANIKAGMWLKVRGPVQEDTWMRDLVITAYDVNEVTHTARQDKAPQDDKRVELHTHTTMSQMDATNSITELATRAHKWGHPAIAVTDHGNVQAFPEAFNVAQKRALKCYMEWKLMLLMMEFHWYITRIMKNSLIRPMSFLTWKRQGYRQFTIR